jgi:histidinol-phosphate aminotransferase
VKAPYNVSELNQKAALDSVENYSEFEERKAAIMEQKELLEKELTKISIVKKVFHSDANFILIETIDANKIYNELVMQKVITRNRNSIMKNCIRITVGTADENKKLIIALNNL